jgi:hypothetical protein
MIELQEALRAIAEAERVQREVPDRLAALDRRIEEEASELNAAREELASGQKERRRLEMDVSSIEAQISRHQEQIFAVKSNEAYRALQHEIEQERARIRATEDRILEIMERAEVLAARIKALEAQHAADRARIEEEKARERERGEAAAREARRLAAAREACEKRLPPDVVEAFHRIARQRGGLAIVRAQNELCGGCNVRLRPQVYQELRLTEKLHTCDSCKRFLYRVEEPKAAAGAESASA